jgi:hypothetical protein
MNIRQSSHSNSALTKYLQITVEADDSNGALLIENGEARCTPPPMLGLVWIWGMFYGILVRILN